jgi:hypothetical protein
MSIKRHLLDDEKILAQTLTADLAELYATNKRIIRYDHSRFGENIESLMYSSIVSVDLIRRRNVRQFIIGMLLFLTGFILAGVGILVVGIVILIVGVALAILSSFRWTTYCQIRALGLSERDMRRWRTCSASDPSVLRFARAVQAQLTKSYPDR